SMASDGTTRVQVQSPRAPARFVTVEPGLSAKGLVAVTRVGGDLGPGDLVVVGDNNAGSPSANGGRGKQTKGAGSGKKKPKFRGTPPTPRPGGRGGVGAGRLRAGGAG